jgi:hypothetical protein
MKLFERCLEFAQSGFFDSDLGAMTVFEDSA